MGGKKSFIHFLTSIVVMFLYHPIFYWKCNYFSMIGLIHVIKGDSHKYVI